LQAEVVELTQNLLSAILQDSTKLEEIYQSVRSPVDNSAIEGCSRE